MRHLIFPPLKRHLPILFVSLFLLLLPSGAQAQVLKACRNKVANGYNFWVSTPKNYDAQHADEYPVVLFLHGKSLCGNNLERVRRYGPLHAQAMGRQIDAIIIAPQNPGGAWNPDRINRVVDWVFAHYGGDTNRLYVLGMSLGGYGTIDYSAAYSHRIAAAMALCGGGTAKSYCGLNDMPLWILHGTADRAVSVSQSEKVVSAMSKCGDSPRLIFTKLPGANHGRLARAFYINETYDWLFKHRLDAPDRPVNKDYDINNDRLQNAYKDINRRANSLVVDDPEVEAEAVASEADSVGGKADGTTTEQDSVASETSSKKVREGKKKSSSDNGGSRYYTIRKGDTLYSISRRYGTTVSKICSLNGISKNTTLRVGRKLKVK